MDNAEKGKDKAPEMKQKSPETKEKAPEKKEKGADKGAEKSSGKGKGAEKKAPEKPAEKVVDKDLKYFVRIRNTDLDGTRSVQISLTKIPGIGRITAQAISKLAKVDPLHTMGKLDDAGVDRLRQVVDNYGPQVPAWMLNRPSDPYTGEGKHLLSTDVLIGKEDDVNRMRKIRCYRGIRHETGQKVRGQRTKSTGRTGTTVGVRRKKE
jgi:small subunit ribosomal protein S13